jgi:predicted DNA-binding ribbon-helix-helix protein
MRDGLTEMPAVAFGQQVPANVATASGAGEQHTQAIVGASTSPRASEIIFMEGLGQRLHTKRSIEINGHPTGVSLEDAFWNALKEIAATRHVSVSDLIATINKERQHTNLSSVLRLFVLEHYCAQVGGRKAAERPIDEKGRPVGAAHSGPI